MSRVLGTRDGVYPEVARIWVQPPGSRSLQGSSPGVVLLGGSCGGHRWSSGYLGCHEGEWGAVTSTPLSHPSLGPPSATLGTGWQSPGSSPCASGSLQGQWATGAPGDTQSTAGFGSGPSRWVAPVWWGLATAAVQGRPCPLPWQAWLQGASRGLCPHGPGSGSDRAQLPPEGTKGMGGGSPPLSDETPAQGSLSLMKGSLCGAGRPLAKDKTSVCPPSLAWGWGPPLRLAGGVGVGTGVHPPPVPPVSCSAAAPPWARPPPGPPLPLLGMPRPGLL